MPMVFACVTVY